MPFYKYSFALNCSKDSNFYYHATKFSTLHLQPAEFLILKQKEYQVLTPNPLLCQFIRHLFVIYPQPFTASRLLSFSIL